MSKIDHHDAQDLLMEAVDHIATVQQKFDGLNDEQAEMLEDGKSSVAAVSINLEGIEFDLSDSDTKGGSDE